MPIPRTSGGGGATVMTTSHVPQGGANSGMQIEHTSDPLGTKLLLKPGPA